MYPDHHIGLPMFLQNNYALRRENRLDIFVPAEAVAGLKALFDMCYLFPMKMQFELEIHPITADFEFEMSDLHVEAIPTTHLARHAKMLTLPRLKNQMQCFAFVIQASGKKIVYSADLGSETDLEDSLDETDLLVAKCSHVDMNRLCEISSKAGVKRLMVTHISESFDLNAGKKALRAAGQKRFVVAGEGLTANFT